ncbi:v-type proton ATPase subunit E [Caerostris extrusa]|uniref:V-type proton ATPase subunit E n=1 Tax=Caerostris extrusa TaxID=172846 RepID=A0AAV4TTN3_CAEEX|nr:v-type proton ATPase subunit E [Caerostris extrusa]
MSLSDDDVQKQINHMMAFIEQEANEKVEEIDAKEETAIDLPNIVILDTKGNHLNNNSIHNSAEEEFNIEKGRLVQEQRLKIMDQSSNMLNQARLKVLKAREDHIRGVLDEAKKKLHSKTKDTAQYQEVLKNLILQAVFQLLEPEVSIKCRKQDLNLVENVLSIVSKEFMEKVGKPCKVVIDKDNFLSPECAGGIELTAQKGKIKINNTLESRLDMISQQLLPEIRETLFGPNPNRKFKD